MECFFSPFFSRVFTNKIRLDDSFEILLIKIIRGFILIAFIVTFENMDPRGLVTVEFI